MCSVSCRSRPDCPFRCNLICTPIILCFSGGCVSRAQSQHAAVFSPSICHCFSLTFTSSFSLSFSHVCRSCKEETSHIHTSPVSVSTSPPPLSLSSLWTYIPLGVLFFLSPSYSTNMWVLSSLLR